MQNNNTQAVKFGSLQDLTTDDKNANLGSERGVSAIEHSLQTYGAGRSILADKNLKLIAGNKTAEGAMSTGIEDIIIVPTTGHQLVVVQRTDLDLDKDAAAMELAIADNRASELGISWDCSMLDVLQQDGVRLNEFWSDGELSYLMRKPSEVVFPEFDESVADGVDDVANEASAANKAEEERHECPKCGHRWED